MPDHAFMPTAMRHAFQPTAVAAAQPNIRPSMKTLISITFLLSAAFYISSWAFGYFILNTPLGLFTPLFFLGRFLVLGTLTFFSIVAVGRANRPAMQRTALILVILAAGCLPFFARPDLSGFAYRVRQIGDASWLKLATDAQTMLRDATPDHQLQHDSQKYWDTRNVSKLRVAHPLLKLGDSYPKLFPEKDSVSVYWGGGLVGFLAVHISTDPNAPEPAPPNVASKRISDVVTISWE